MLKLLARLIGVLTAICMVASFFLALVKEGTKAGISNILMTKPPIKVIGKPTEKIFN